MTGQLLKHPVNIKKHSICQPFGLDHSQDPVYKNFYTLFDNKHPGVDFSLPVGTQVLASYPGIVVRKEFCQGVGKTIGTRNGNIVILYAHLSKFAVKLGQKVKTGDLIGYSGKTGKACPQPHLHFEIRDITKPTLKEMVFDPPFGKLIKSLKNTFTYAVNNKNTRKTLSFLALRYFGNKKYWKHILKANPHLNYHQDRIIQNRVKVLIPNYNSSD